MTRWLVWHAYGTPPLPNPYATVDPDRITHRPGHEQRLLNMLRQKKNKPLDSKKYGIPEGQVDFAHTIDENVIKFFGWEDCAKIIQAYRDWDISALSNYLNDFFTKTQDKNPVSVKKVNNIFRLIPAHINSNPDLVARIQEDASAILSMAEKTKDINSWLIHLKFAIQGNRDQDWERPRAEISEIIQGSIH